MNIDLSNKIALVTGGSRGIGAAIVRMLATAGADIAFTYHAHEAAARRTRQAVEKLGRRCMMLSATVSNGNQVHAAVRKTLGEFGCIDILVNNAGIWKRGAMGKMSERLWDETLDINLKSVFLFCNEVVPAMIKQGGGRIVNIASTAGQRGEPFYSHYAASKGGIIALTKSLGPELIRHHILVNCVAPGWVETDMSASALRAPGAGAEIRKTIPRGRVASTEEIAGCVLFLASELSNNMVGSIISSNGGAVLSN